MNQITGSGVFQSGKAVNDFQSVQYGLMDQQLADKPLKRKACERNYKFSSGFLFSGDDSFYNYGTESGTWEKIKGIFN